MALTASPPHRPKPIITNDPAPCPDDDPLVAIGVNVGFGSQADNQRPNAVRNQMPHNKWLQGTRETAVSCFAGVVSRAPLNHSVKRA